MNAQFRALGQALRSSRAWCRPAGPGVRPRMAPFVSSTCARKFSASSLLRQIRETASKAAENIASKPVVGAVPKSNAPSKLPEHKSYPEHLVVYNAGEFRLTMVAFWKAVAIFQFGVTSLILAPNLWWNENQPDETFRKMQAVGVFILGSIPPLILGYLTAPFVKTVAIRLPPHARRSHAALHQFTSNTPPETLLEFTTLRIFPIQRKTTCFLFEMRALPHQWWRFANLERKITERLVTRRQKMSRWRRFLEVVNEPRFKFHVKEGRQFEAKTPAGVGVWRNIARQIRLQTEKVEVAAAKLDGLRGGRAGGQEERVEKIKAKFLKLEGERTGDEGERRVRRQTARSAR
ncbi:uncharacterized protein EI97DRAFT_430466 [Westerdykella ornata]|uniref:Uncharacterized protein n=1 Tax=Westerdykella ornata TaxID=318751 RepID=A0A6A6JU77_WESOR|nr:uncharacterized protein EI97DRAFT_430466 [Westerdykella ornata]KAF2279388.1 hypothetical protein EI97DRAFT_430466 [Westerdykella ornata]